MIVVFEVFLVPGADPDTILTDEIKSATKAQLMTLDEARKVGFAGLPDQPGHDVRLIAVAVRDKAWIIRTLEGSDAVGQFKVHDVD